MASTHQLPVSLADFALYVATTPLRENIILLFFQWLSVWTSHCLIAFYIIVASGMIPTEPNGTCFVHWLRVTAARKKLEDIPSYEM